MNTVTSSSPPAAGLFAEPPVSPPLAAPAAAGEIPQLRTPAPPAPPARPVEAQLVQQGLLTVGQLAQAHRERLETGRPVLEIAIEHGWLTEEDVVEATGEPIAAPAPALPEAPKPEREPEPDPEPEPPPLAPAARHYRVELHLTGGERIDLGSADDEAKAQALARDAVIELMTPHTDQWPFFAGRFVRPDAVLSVDLIEKDTL